MTLAKLDPAATMNMGVVTVGLGFQTKEVVKERKGRRNSKESFAKMNKNREIEDSIGSKMVQGNLKVTKKAMKKSRGGKAEPGTNEGDKKNNLTRTLSWDLMLAWGFPISKIFVLDQAIADELTQLVLHHGQSRPDLLRSPHGHELLVLDH
jgi:hypothetical protein